MYKSAMEKIREKVPCIPTEQRYISKGNASRVASGGSWRNE